MNKKKPQLNISNKTLFFIISLIIGISILLFFIIVFRGQTVQSDKQNNTVTQKIDSSKEKSPKNQVKPTKTPTVIPSEVPSASQDTQKDKKTSPVFEHEPSQREQSAPAQKPTPTQKPSQREQSTPAQKPAPTQKPSQREQPTPPQKPTPPTKPAVAPTPIPQKTGKIVLIFDDGGNSLAQTLPFLDLPFALTVAVLPKLPDSVPTARAVRAAHKELFLHQPMQALNLAINPGPGAILPTMTTGEAATMLRSNINELGPIAGMNNHEGSLITADRNLMGAVLDVCIDTGLIFLDSRTNSKTVVPLVALERDFPLWERDIFLDNTQNKADILAMLDKGLKIADKKGYVIMIGHVWSPILVSLLSEQYPILKKQGYVFTTLSKLKR